MSRISLFLIIFLTSNSLFSYTYIPTNFVHEIRKELDHEDFQQALVRLGKRIGANMNLSDEEKECFCHLLYAYRDLMLHHSAVYADHEACEAAEQRFYELCEKIWPEGSQQELELEEIVDVQLSEQYASKLMLRVIDAVLSELD